MLQLIPVAVTVALVVGYAVGLHRLRQHHVSWSPGRSACLVAGSMCVVAALVPPVASHDELFPVHVAQHLLLGMIGPALLALSAPVTLALRAVTGRSRRVLVRLVHSRVVQLLSNPVVALVLDLGGVFGLYLSGLYARLEDSDVLHAAVHLHMVIAGCLLSWALIGIDPLRRRPGLAMRMSVLVVAGAAHDVLSKLMYAHGLPVGGGPLSARQAGAELMYYGGTVVDVALAAVVMTQWWQVSGRALARQRRRATVTP